MTRPILLSLSLLFPLAAAPGVARAGACAQIGWEPVLLTSAKTPIPAGGGVLLTVKSGGHDEPGKQPAVRELTLKKGRRQVALRAESLGPGIARYQPKKMVKGTWQIAGESVEGEVAFAEEAAEAPPPPRLAAVHRYRTEYQTHYGGTRKSTHVVARLGAAPPEEALGLLLYRADGEDTPAVLFERVGSGAEEVKLYSTPGRCQPHLDADDPPPQGAEVCAAWLARDGALSECSDEVEVVRGEPEAHRDDGWDKGPENEAANEPGSEPESEPESENESRAKGCTAGASGAGTAPIVLLVAILTAVTTRRRAQKIGTSPSAAGLSPGSSPTHASSNWLP